MKLRLKSVDSRARLVATVAFCWTFARAAEASVSGTNIFAPKSTPAHTIFGLSLFVLSVTAVIFVVVFALLTYSIVKFRARAVDAGREPAQVYGSTQIEIAWTVIPVPT